MTEPTPDFTREYGLIEPTEELPTTLFDDLEEAREWNKRWGSTDKLVQRFITPWVPVEDEGEPG